MGGVAPIARMSEAEYLAYDLAHEEKHEYVNGEVLAMSGVSEQHSAIQMNLGAALTVRLRGGPCRVHGSDLRVHIGETGMYCYPDLTVVCGVADFAATRPESLLNPRVIVEVLSESTDRYDLSAKAAHYRKRPSVQSIVFVDSRRRWVQTQTRNADGTWTLADLESGDIALGAVGTTVPMDEVYEGVALPA